MKEKKWNKLNKNKRSSYSPVAFKYGCSLEIYLELWRKKKGDGEIGEHKLNEMGALNMK